MNPYGPEIQTEFRHFSRGNDLNSEKRGISESPPDRYVPFSRFLFSSFFEEFRVRGIWVSFLGGLLPNASTPSLLSHSWVALILGGGETLGLYPLRRNGYQNNSVNIFSCNCPGAITGFSCRAPEKNSPKRFSCTSPCPVRAPLCNSPWASYRIFL